MNRKRPSSDFLFAQPSALFGCARLFDIGSFFDEYNSCDSPEEADAKAMYADWSVVGETLESTIRSEQQLQQSDDTDEKAA